MKSLRRNDKGELMLSESADASTSIEHSPIVTETNFPKQGVATTKPTKQSLATTLLSEEQLLAEMRKAGGKALTTQQFAILIAPCVKKSIDAAAHHRWDLSLGYTRFLMRKLEKQGKIKIIKDISSKRTRYLYSIA